MKKFAQMAGNVALFLAPALVFATQDLEMVFNEVGDLVGVLTPVIVGIALLGFFWGLAMYVLNFSGEDKDKKKGRDMMVYGILVLFVIVSVWGIVQLLQQQFLGTTSVTGSQEVPRVITPNSAPTN